ncbi:MAG: hypothetical protein ACLS43_11585 [Evtepia gabavorous]
MIVTIPHQWERFGKPMTALTDVEITLVADAVAGANDIVNGTSAYLCPNSPSSGDMTMLYCRQYRGWTRSSSGESTAIPMGIRSVTTLFRP